MWFQQIKSAEYLSLLEKIERLRILFESLKLDMEITRNKLKAKKGIVEEEETKKEVNILLPEK